MTDGFNPNTDTETTPTLIDRRHAIKRVSAMLGGVALVGGSAIWTACGADRSASENATKAGKNIGRFTPSDVAFLDEVADTILPDTPRSPGAKAAKVGAYMAVMVTDCYEPKDQDIFRAGFATLNDASTKSVGVEFLKATPAQRLTVLEALDKEAKQYMDARKSGEPTHFFRMMKELAFVGYFTSEVGMTKALRYIESPGRFDPCVPIAKGETLWASHA